MTRVPEGSTAPFEERRIPRAPRALLYATLVFALAACARTQPDQEAEALAFAFRDQRRQVAPRRRPQRRDPQSRHRDRLSFPLADRDSDRGV
jgi:hypothetical protein